MARIIGTDRCVKSALLNADKWYHCAVAAYHRRFIEPLLANLLAEVPALLIVGPRASGKTTTAIRYAKTTVRLDRPSEAAAFRADPDAALRGLAEPVLLDEWQAVPEVLGAVKRAVDTDPRPGRYLLTGSVRADLDSDTWPGTGRLVRLAMYPLTASERLEHPGTPPLLDRLSRADELELPSSPPDLRQYVELALESGFPEAALSLSPAVRQRWLESYVDQLLTRDVQQFEDGRDPTRLRRYFEAYALNSAGIVDDKTLYDSAGINRRTALAYERLLTQLLVVDAIPAWTSNRLKRLMRSAKRYLVDPALLTGLLRADANAVLRDGNLLGRVIETFVVAQLRAEVVIAETRPRLYHLRQEQGRKEIDLLAELGADRIIGIEIKADSAPGKEAANHLAWLRDELGDRFVAGVVLHTGHRVYALGERIRAVPICTLWA
jgi:predicted AAA+ superfamily ATPase